MRADDDDPLGVEQLRLLGLAELDLVAAARAPRVSQSTRPSRGAPSASSFSRWACIARAAAGRIGAGRRPRPRRAARRASARRRSSAATRARSRSSRCSTYSAILAAGSVIQGPWPGQSSSSVERLRAGAASPCSRRASRRRRGGTIVEPWPRIRSPQKQTAPRSEADVVGGVARGRRCDSQRRVSPAAATRRSERLDPVRVVAVAVGEQDAADPAPRSRRRADARRCGRRRRARDRSPSAGSRADDVGVGPVERHRPRVRARRAARPRDGPERRRGRRGPSAGDGLEHRLAGLARARARRGRRRP